MMKTPEEMNAINRETFKARAERLCRLLDSHPAAWTAEDARFYADYREAMEETAGQAQQGAHDAAERLASQNELPDMLKSAFAALNGSTKAAKPLTALINAALEADSNIDENRLWRTLKDQEGVEHHKRTGDSETEWISLNGDRLERPALRGRLHTAKKNHANS
jgi:hypothetical protein